jgi:TonB-linked SusC/RagA family outer membrane protein
MYKNLTTNFCRWHSYNLFKLLRVMKISVILIMATILQVSAAGYAQRVTLKISNSGLEDVLRAFRSQTGFDFLYDAEQIKAAKPITLSLINTPLSEALEKCLINQPFTYQINHQTVVIKKKETPGGIINPPPSQVTGRITDEKGLPLPGVSIKIKGTTTATSTTANGSYRIMVPSSNATLIFSFVGFAAREIVVGNRTQIDVTLKQELVGLNEIVVVGYGQVQRKDLTGAVGQVKMSDLEKAPVASFDQALAGRLAGVQVSSNDGQPGSEGINIVIRGNGSLTQTSSPLYVIDGFPIEDFNASSLNVNDIESINVLKDASSTAIYGSRGANGVVVIETKKGKVGNPVITYNGSYGLQDISKRMDVMSGYEFVKYQIDKGSGANYLLNGQTPESYLNAPVVNWQDKIFKTGRTNIQSIALRGGKNQTKYAISTSLFNSNAVVINSGNQRYQGRISLTQEVNKKFNVGVNLNYSRNSNYGVPVSTAGGSSATAYLLYSAWGYRPLTGDANYSLDDLESGTVDDDVNPAADFRVNPVVSATNQYNKSFNSNVLSNVYGTYEIAKNLTLKVTGGLNNTYARYEAFYNSKTILGNNYNPANVRGQFGSKSYSELSTWSNENTLTYVTNLNKSNKLDFLTGFTLQGTQTSGGGYTSINVPNEQLGVNGLSQGTPQIVTSPASSSAIESFLFRTNYNYKSKYLLTATFRADGSSKFSPENRWGYFPSGAFAWRMSNEPFMKKMTAISDAKLRLSYGLTGNNRVPDFAYFASVNPTNNAAYPFNNGIPTQGVIIPGLGNSDLKWETTGQADIGYDLSLFNDRLNLTADVYRKITKDLLLNANMPYNTGYNTVYENVGKLQNQGLEITINSVNINTGKFKWESNFNISFNRNKILALTGDNEPIYNTLTWESAYNNSNLYKSEVGKSAGNFYGFVWDGNYQVNDFDVSQAGAYTLKPTVTANGNSRASIKPGDIKYKDLNGDGDVTLDDQIIIGNGLPKHVGGFSNDFSYMGFSLNVFLQWSYGNDIFNANRLIFEGSTYSNLNQFATYENRWTLDNPTDRYYRAGGGGPAGRYSSRVIEDGSYLRLKTVALGYNVPAKFLKSLNINSLNFSLTAQNLYTFTKYSGMDPEVSVRNSVLTPGFDYSAYPHARTIVLGITANF